MNERIQTIRTYIIQNITDEKIIIDEEFFPWTDLSDFDTQTKALDKLEELESKYINEKFRLILREEFERVIKQTRKFNIDDVVQVQTGSQKGAIGKVIEIDNNTVKISYGGTWTGYESHENLKIWIDKNLAE